MNCVEINDIVSTYVQSESTFNYEELFIMSNKKLMSFLDIKKKHEEIYGLSNNESNENSFYREFNYKFRDYIDIGKIIFSDEYIIKGFEIYNIENEGNKTLISSSEIKKSNGKVLIDVGLKVKGLCIRLESKRNLWPKLDEIKLIIL